MKRKIILATVLTMMLCGCNEAKSSSAQQSKAEKTTATTASQEETADAETTTIAEETTTESETAEAASTTAADEDGTASDDENATATASLNDDLFEGLYYNKSDRNDTLSIDCQNDTLYSVHISRKKSANETVEWYFTGEFNGRQVLNYENCVKSTMTVGEDGSVMSGTEYTDGTGYIQISETGEETGFVWHDAKENAGANDFFIKQ